MKKSVYLAVTAVVMSLSVSAQAASFNCNLARTATEKAICANSRLSEADVKLGNTYNILLRFAKQDYAVYDIQESQRDWLKQRNECGSRVACIREEYAYRQTQLERDLQRYQ